MNNIDLFFTGNTTFKNSLAYRGGALHLIYTTIYLHPGANVMFLNNTATDVGGAIHMFTGEYNTKPLDFQSQISDSYFKLTYNVRKNAPLGSSLHFVNNSALNGGVNVYGTSLKSDRQITPDGQTKSYEIQDELFHFDRAGLSPVSSYPKRVCLCESEEPRCASSSYIFQDRSYTSGEKFKLSLALVGDDFGTVTGGVYALFQHPSDDSWLGAGQNVQLINKFSKCSELEYSVHSRKANETLFLVADVSEVFETYTPNFIENVQTAFFVYQTDGEITHYLSFTPIFLNINISNCPLGFFLDDRLLTCQCIGALVKNGVNNCTVTNGTGIVYRSGTTWVSHSASETDGVLILEYCPYGYCKSDTIGVDLFHPDSQCAFDHSGILCGGCSPNLSLALGSSQCLPCTNDGHIALLLAFIIAGFALVFFIKALNLTVAIGTINGLILYANIIWINQSIFFPPGSAYFLKIFVAWLNLDLGVETCFFHGLDTYWKTWLQFVFPIYVWMIVGIIIAI